MHHELRFIVRCAVFSHYLVVVLEIKKLCVELIFTLENFSEIIIELNDIHLFSNKTYVLILRFSQ